MHLWSVEFAIGDRAITSGHLCLNSCSRQDVNAKTVVLFPVCIVERGTPLLRPLWLLSALCSTVLTGLATAPAHAAIPDEPLAEFAIVNGEVVNDSEYPEVVR